MTRRASQSPPARVPAPASGGGASSNSIRRAMTIGANPSPFVPSYWRIL